MQKNKLSVIFIGAILAIGIFICGYIFYNDRNAKGSEIGDDTKVVSKEIDLVEGYMFEPQEVKDSNLTIEQGGTYILSGDYSTVNISASKSDTIQLILDNATIESENGPAIYVGNAKIVYIMTVEDTNNIIKDSASYDVIDLDEKADGAIFSHSDLYLGGTGSLTVQGNYKHGIVSKDDIYIVDGDIVVSAVRKSFEGKDNIFINGGNITIPNCCEGLEASRIFMNDGNLDVIASDDGMNATSDDKNEEIFIEINGGSLTILADGDGLDANGNIDINGGFVSISTNINGPETMIDIDGIGKINGGSVIASGGAAMDCSISDQSGQNIIAYSTERIEEGTRIVLKDKNGEEMISHEPLRSCSFVYISTPEMVTGETYELIVGDVTEQFTLSDIITEAGVQSTINFHNGQKPNFTDEKRPDKQEGTEGSEGPGGPGGSRGPDGPKEPSS